MPGLPSPLQCHGASAPPTTQNGGLASDEPHLPSLQTPHTGLFHWLPADGAAQRCRGPAAPAPAGHRHAAAHRQLQAPAAHGEERKPGHEEAKLAWLVVACVTQRARFSASLLQAPPQAPSSKKQGASVHWLVVACMAPGSARQEARVRCPTRAETYSCEPGQPRPCRR